MYNSNIPSEHELPSTAKLVKSTVLAAITALVLLVTIVMPAEYGIDPTGIGNAMGLKKMGEIKVSLAEEADAEKEAAAKASSPAGTIIHPTMAESKIEAKAAPAAATTPATRSDKMSVTLAPNEGAEIKVDMLKGQKANYTWSTDGGKANFDVHGDSKDLNINYHNYSKGSEQSKEGVVEAAFDGSHGWFWRNRTSKTVTITLKTTGEYTNIKRMN